MPKYGFVTRCCSGAPIASCSTVSWFRLVSGIPTLRDVRADVRHFERHVRRQLALDRHVPLLRVSRAEPALTENTPWPRPAVGVGAIGATLGPFCSTNAGDMLSSARCDGLQERERGRGEGRRDARHLDPDQAVARTDHGLVGQPIDDAEARTEVVFFSGRTGFLARVSSCCVCRLKTAVWPLISVDGKFSV